MVQTDDIEFEYANLQDPYGDPEPCSPEETVVPFDTSNERQNYYNTMEFITNQARRDQMIDNYILTQYSLKAGLRKFREDSHKATMKELQEMSTQEVFGGIDQDSLTYEQKRKALPVVLFLTLKYDGSTIKSRACADRRLQRIWTEEQDASSPTITIEDILNPHIYLFNMYLE